MRSGDEPNKNAMGQKFNKQQFPNTLEGFGYAFNSYGQLRHIETGQSFNFEVIPGDRAFNQRHYEALGEVITEYVYNLLEMQGNLKKLYLPVNAKPDESSNFIFLSDNARDCEKLMILIHGSGVVRAGQWSRKLIINDCLDSGTMLPYIRRAAQEGYGVIITNGNNIPTVNRERKFFRQRSHSPEEHIVYVWDHVISKSKATIINIVAHSYGGVVTVHLSKAKKEEFLKRVRAVAFTDSVHSLSYQVADKEIQQFFHKKSRNWVSCDKPLDSPLQSFYQGVDSEKVSAGTIRHEETSSKAIESVFKYFAENLDQTSDTNTSAKRRNIQLETEQNNASSSLNTEHLMANSNHTEPQQEDISDQTGTPATREQGMEKPSHSKDITDQTEIPAPKEQEMKEFSQSQNDQTETPTAKEQERERLSHSKVITDQTEIPAPKEQGMKELSQSQNDQKETPAAEEQEREKLSNSEDITDEAGTPAAEEQEREKPSNSEDITDEAGTPAAKKQEREKLSNSEDVTDEAGTPAVKEQVMEESFHTQDSNDQAGSSATSGQAMEGFSQLQDTTGLAVAPATKEQEMEE